LYVVPCTIDHTVTGVHTSNACTPAPVSTDKAMAPPFHPTCIEYGSFSLFKVSHLFTRKFRKEYLFLQERSLISAFFTDTLSWVSVAPRLRKTLHFL
jgi:hypothetical protein